MIPSSPHLPARPTVSKVMVRVSLCLVPGIAAATVIFGWGVLANLAIASLAAVITEAVLVRMRGRDVAVSLADGSAVLTGLLLGLAIPAVAPWWLPAFGAAFAIAFGKQLYGGLGYNPFNPAMLGYVVLLISFPTEMTLWAAPLAERAPADGVAAGYFLGTLGADGIDAITAATPLDAVKTGLGLAQTVTEAGAAVGREWVWINLAFLAGGAALLGLRTIRWQIPAGMLGGLALMAILFSAIDADRNPGLVHHLLGGATMLGAFFIATDPVSASTTPRGRLIYGFGIGVLTYLIRAWGGYPDGVAFAVLLMNICVPLIDHNTPPRAYGHAR